MVFVGSKPVAAGILGRYRATVVNLSRVFPDFVEAGRGGEYAPPSRKREISGMLRFRRRIGKGKDEKGERWKEEKRRERERRKGKKGNVDLPSRDSRQDRLEKYFDLAKRLER